MKTPKRTPLPFEPTPWFESIFTEDDFPPLPDKEKKDIDRLHKLVFDDDWKTPPKGCLYVLMGLAIFGIILLIVSIYFEWVNAL